MNPLQHGGDAFETHAGVDRRARQIEAGGRVDLLVLHEDEVPDLDEAVAVLVGAARGATGDVIAVIEEDFAARTARAGVAHRPKIIGGGDADDALGWQAGNRAPQVEGFVVGVIDGDRQAGWVEAPDLGQQRPRLLDRLRLEVVAEREVAEHLEKGVVACGVADVVEIVMLAAGADALLRRHGGRVGTRLEAGEDVLERHHAGVDEHQRRIVLRHQRGRRHDAVPGAAEEVEKAAADVVGDHRRGLGER